MEMEKNEVTMTKRKKIIQRVCKKEKKIIK